MISAEFILVFGVILFTIGLAITHFQRSSWPSLVMYAAGLGLCAWVLLAANVTPTVDDVTYHPVKQGMAARDTPFDYIVVKDADGKQHFVNLNEALGIKVPQDGRAYKIARVSYKQSVLGLSFDHSAKYQLITDQSN